MAISETKTSLSRLFRASMQRLAKLNARHDNWHDCTVSVS